MNHHQEAVRGIILPCNGCTACCQRDLIFLDQKKDEFKKYEIEVTERFAHPVAVIKHKPNGDCWYLDRDKGCTIWDGRPSLCREFDCRVFLAMDPSKLIEAGVLRQEIVDAAREMAARFKSKEKRKPRDEWKIPGKAQCRRQGKARKKGE